jgi:hypothetical protein
MSEEKEFDPVLREAMLEIQAVMKKHQIGGMVNLISKTHGELGIEFPDWIGVAQEDLGMRIKFKKEETDLANLTGHFIYSIIDVCGHTSKGFKQLAKVLEDHCEVEHEFKFRPHSGLPQ